MIGACLLKPSLRLDVEPGAVPNQDGGGDRGRLRRTRLDVPGDGAPRSRTALITRSMAVVDWRARRELWRADTANCLGVAAVGGRLACSTDAGVDWYDLRRGGNPTSTPLRHAAQLAPLADGKALAFSTWDPSPPDPAGPREPDSFGVLDADGVRWQQPVTNQSETFDRVYVKVTAEQLESVTEAMKAYDVEFVPIVGEATDSGSYLIEK